MTGQDLDAVFARQRDKKAIEHALMLWAFLPHLFVVFLLIHPFYLLTEKKLLLAVLLVVVGLVLLESLGLMRVLYRHFPMIRRRHAAFVLVTTLCALVFYLPSEPYFALKVSAYLLVIPYFIGSLLWVGGLASDDVVARYRDVMERSASKGKR